MEIRVLRYFLTVVREESITKASEVLHITQPTLSRQLAQMEEDIGVKLFDRGTRKIKLTNEGILLRRRAEEILQLVDKTEKELVEQEEQVEGKISIGCGEIAAVQLLPKIIESFRRKYPRVTFDIFTATADLVKEQMEKGLLDIGLLLEPIEMEKGILRKMPLVYLISTLMSLIVFPVLARDPLTNVFFEGDPRKFDAFLQERGAFIKEVLVRLLTPDQPKVMNE